MRARSKRGAAVAVSVAVHLAILAVLFLSTPILRLPTARFAPDISVDLSRPPELRRTREQPVAAAAPRASSSAQAAKPLPAASAAAPVVAPPKTAPPSPSPLPAPTPTPAPTATAAAGAAPGVAAGAAGAGRDWRVHPEDGDFRGAVRAAIGCGHVDHLKLTADEQAACNRRLGDLRGANLPHYDAISPEKRAYYDAVAATYAKMHAPTPVPFAVIGPGTNLVGGERWAGAPGAHPPGFGCKIPFGIPKGWKAPKGGPPHSLKLGPLPCFITPPSGLFTEEADLPDPTTLGPKR